MTSFSAATEHLPSPAEEDATSPAPTAIVATASAPIPPPVRPVRATPSIVEPLREDRYRLQLNASAELKRKLERVRDLMSHTNPSGDLAVVVERALDLLIDKLERERFAQTTRARKDAKPQHDKRRVSNATRREVVERDGLQCSYVSPEGERCPSRQFLQFHHELAWALGGKSDTPNSRIFCANHNKLRAEQDFGKERIAQVVATARTRPRKTIC